MTQQKILSTQFHRFSSFCVKTTDCWFGVTTCRNIMKSSRTETRKVMRKTHQRTAAVTVRVDQQKAFRTGANQRSITTLITVCVSMSGCYRCCPFLDVDTSQGRGRVWSNFRRTCFLIARHKYFDIFIIFIIMLSSVALVNMMTHNSAQWDQYHH